MKKKYGQNFLINKKIAIKEIEYANIKKDDVVLEIGPGNGILTHLLAKKAKKVIAIEIDARLVKNLRETIPENVDLIQEDVLKVDFSTLPRFNKIVSNLPYHISSPITFKILEIGFSLAVLVYQKEFAYRMVASPGTKNYSRLSVSVFYFAECEIIDHIHKSCFYPEPRIDSCIVSLIPKKTPSFSVLDERFFFYLTRELFNHRRKKIKNILEIIFPDTLFEDITFGNSRIEKLSPEQIGKLSDDVHHLVRK
jgi:16S rRNA (adenine1518-N6/adenine1519-N6)-dimethyltransferase